MRTQEELNSKEFNDDMSELETELKNRGIEYTITKHLGALEGGGKVKKLIGYYPTGEWHIYIGDVSVIRGMVSFGDYEAYGGKFTEPERFSTAKELVDSLQSKPEKWEKEEWEIEFEKDFELWEERCLMPPMASEIVKWWLPKIRSLLQSEREKARQINQRKI